MPLVFEESDFGHFTAPALGDYVGYIQDVEMCWVPIKIFRSITWEKKKMAKTETISLQVREER